MAAPQLTVTTNKTAYAPGEAITGGWVSVDPDNASLTVEAKGTDSQGNEVTVNTVITRVDPFTMTSLRIVETNTVIPFNNTARTFAGTIPTA